MDWEIDGNKKPAQGEKEKDHAVTPSLFYFSRVVWCDAAYGAIQASLSTAFAFRVWERDYGLLHMALESP